MTKEEKDCMLQWLVEAIWETIAMDVEEEARAAERLDKAEKEKEV